MFETTQMFGLKPETLTPFERRMFTALARDPHRVVTKQELVDALSSGRAHTVVHTRTVDSVAVRLRSMILGASGRRAVVNVWGVGYRLLDPEPEAT